MDTLLSKNLAIESGTPGEGANKDVGYITFFPDGKETFRQSGNKGSKTLNKEAHAPALSITSPTAS